MPRSRCGRPISAEMTLLGGFFQGRSSTPTLYGLFGFSPYAWSQSIFGRVRRSFERGCRDLAAGDQISAEMTLLGGFFQGRSSTPTLYGLFGFSPYAWSQSIFGRVRRS